MPNEYLLFVLTAVALINGGNIVFNRILNARLAMHVGAMRSSYWNHLVGLLFMVVYVGFFPAKEITGQDWASVPWHLWLGGVVGVGFVWLINRVILLLGAVQTMLVLLVSQMIFGLVADVLLGKVRSLGWATAGVVVLLMGMALRVRWKKKVY
jgi:transporter family-2 protein